MVTSTVCRVLLCLLFTSVGFAGSDPVLDRANGKSLSNEKNAVCLPTGPRAFAVMKINPKDEEIILKKDFKIGPMVIPKGCTLSLGYGIEITGKETDKELAETQYVRGISQCRASFPILGMRFLSATFNAEGCLDGMQSLGEKKEICGKILEPQQPIYFDNGFLDCTGLKEKEETRL